MDKPSSTPALADQARLTVFYSLLVVAGLASLCLSAWGFLMSLMLDYRTTDVLLTLCLVLPLPVFLSSLRSLRLAVFLLWILFVGQWFVRQFVVQMNTHRPNPALNPLDEIGVVYFGIAVVVQAAYLLKNRGEALKDSGREP
jgi:hypothetical protein